MNRLSLLILTVLVQLFSIANAQTYTWNGSISDDWSDAINWTPNGIPGVGDTVQINSDAVPNPCLLDGDRTIATLDVSAGTLDLNYYILTASSNAGFTGGVVQNGDLFTSSIDDISATTFEGAVSMTKTGGTNNDLDGGNTFNGPFSITNSGTARIRMSRNVGDVFNDDAQFINNSASTLDVAYQGTTTFAGNVTIDNSGTGGITIGAANNAGTSITIASGGGLQTNGFTNGRLIIRRTTQNGTGPNTLFTPTSFIASNCTFGGNFSVNALSTTITITDCSFTATNSFTAASNILISGVNNFSTVSGTTTITRNGGTANSTWAGGNSFGNLVLTNNSNFNIRLSGTTGNSYLGTAQFTNTGTANIEVSYSGTNTFAGDIKISNSGTGGISFGINGGTSVQSSGSMLTNGYTNGPLSIYNFTQSSSVANERFNPTTCEVNNCTFNGNFLVTTTSGTLTINQCVFNGTNSFISASNIALSNPNRFSQSSGSTAFNINGGANTVWTGGNTFGNVTITLNSANYLRLADTIPNDFNGSATFIQASTGVLSPTYNVNSTFAGDISTVVSVASIIFGSGTGRVTIDGNGTQTLYGSVSFPPVFRRLTMNTSGGGDLTLDVPIDITLDLTLTSGIINTTGTKIIELTDETTTTTVGSESSYVNGPMLYTMNSNSTTRSTLNFPIGKGGEWRPVILKVAHSVTTQYTYQAEVINSSAVDLGYTLPPTVNFVSGARYWDVDRYLTSSMTEEPSANLRTIAGQEPEITLYFDVSDVVYDGSDLVVCKNTVGAPSSWIDVGGTGAPAYNGGALLKGSVTSTSSPSLFNSFSIFTMGSFSENPLPVTLVSFEATPVNGQVELTWKTSSEFNSRDFQIERSQNGQDFEVIDVVSAAGTSSVPRSYHRMDKNPYSGYNYYRLRQIDWDEQFTLYDIRTAYIASMLADIEYSLFPNPFSDRIQLNAHPGLAEGSVVRMYNAFGQLVLQQVISGASSNTLETDQLSSGVYFIEAGPAEAPLRAKVIKN